MSELSQFNRVKARLDAMTSNEAGRELDRLIRGLEEDAIAFGETLHDKKILSQYKKWKVEYSIYGSKCKQ